MATAPPPAPDNRPVDDPAYPDPATRNVLEPECSRCPALADARERIAWGNGSTAADVVAVGEAPGSGDPDAARWQGGNWTGLAYTARHSGRIVRSLFERLGYGPGDVYLTNAVKCFPAAPDDPTTNREPTAIERRTCFDHLASELAQVDPAVVVTTGRHATTALLEREGIALDGFVDRILEPVGCPTLDVTVVPILHPSYQSVWLSRLDLTEAAYTAQLGNVIDAVLEAESAP